MSEEREFTDATGRSWRASYTGSEVKGLVNMRQVVFRSQDGRTLYLSVYPSYLKRVDQAGLRVALTQAQPVDPPR